MTKERPSVKFKLFEKKYTFWIGNEKITTNDLEGTIQHRISEAKSQTLKDVEKIIDDYFKEITTDSDGVLIVDEYEQATSLNGFLEAQNYELKKRLKEKLRGLK